RTVATPTSPSDKISVNLTYSDSNEQRSPRGVYSAPLAHEQEGSGDHQSNLNTYAQRSREAFRGKVRRTCPGHGRRETVGKETQKHAQVEGLRGGGGYPFS
ncbi:unnamed protein product, partial [Pylaiella littoralis]